MNSNFKLENVKNKKVTSLQVLKNTSYSQMERIKNFHFSKLPFENTQKL